MKRRNISWLNGVVIILIIGCLLITGCRGSDPGLSTQNQTQLFTIKSTAATTEQSQAQSNMVNPITKSPTMIVSLTGAGASFPNPLYTKWFAAYFNLAGVKVNYQSIGSGAGIQQITSGTVDFGASDGIMSADQEAAAETNNGPILHIPMTSGAVAIIYNLPGVNSGQLKFTGDVLVNIYLKKIIKWNDPRILALNPGVNLPDADIAVVHRSDGSGTSYIITNYFCNISDEWKNNVGNGLTVNWPGDIGGQGSAGVAGGVQNVPNSIGYVELSYALQNSLTFAQMQNSSGKYLLPSLEGTTKASEGVSLPDDGKAVIANSSNPEAYPIVGFTWMLVYVNQKNKDRGQTLVNMLWWAIHDGQKYCADLDYAALSSDAVAKAEKQIASIKYQGQPFISR